MRNTLRSVVKTSISNFGSAVSARLRKADISRDRVLGRAVYSTLEHLETRILFGRGINYGSQIPTACDVCADPQTQQHSEGPIVYATGVPVLSSADISSDAFGMSFGQTRKWTGTNEASLNGNGWANSSLSFLVLKQNQHGDHGAIIGVVEGGSLTQEFNVEYDNDVITPRYESLNKLEYINPTGTTQGAGIPGMFRLTATDGSITTFYDLPRDADWRLNANAAGDPDFPGYVQAPTNQWLDGSTRRDGENGTGMKYRFGAFRSYVDPSGKLVINASYEDGNLSQVTRTDGTENFERWSYSYVTVENDFDQDTDFGEPDDDGVVDLIESVTLERGTGDPYDAESVNNWEVARKAEYQYYTGDDGDDASKYGRLGDLKLVTIYNDLDDIVDQKYYRYNKFFGDGPTGLTASSLANDVEKTMGSDPTFVRVGDEPEFVMSGVKSVFEGKALVNLVETKGVGATFEEKFEDVDDLPDSVVNPYSKLVFKYERVDPGEISFLGPHEHSTRYRVVEEMAAAEGCSSCSEGFGVYKFDYSPLITGYVDEVGRYDDNATTAANTPVLRTIEWLSDSTNELLSTNISIINQHQSTAEAIINWDEHGFAVGEEVTIDNNQEGTSDYEGTFEITFVDDNSFRVLLDAIPAEISESGSITVTNLDRIEPTEWLDNPRSVVYTNRMGGSILSALEDVRREPADVTPNTAEHTLGVDVDSITFELANHGFYDGQMVMVDGIYIGNDESLAGRHLVYAYRITVLNANEFTMSNELNTTETIFGPLTSGNAFSTLGKMFSDGEQNDATWSDIRLGAVYPTFTHYYSDNRVEFVAHPSALKGWDELLYEDLISLDPAVTEGRDPDWYYFEDEGLLDVYEYGTVETENLDDGTDVGGESGDVVGYLKSKSVRNGFDDERQVLVESYEYWKHEYTEEINSVEYDSVVYPLASTLKYWDVDRDNDLGDENEGTLTQYEYRYAEDDSDVSTNRIVRQKVITNPVSTERNGSGGVTFETSIFDELGRTIWHMDENGYINHTEYGESGGIVSSIVDYETGGGGELVLDLVGSGNDETWYTPEGGGTHLVTEYRHDDLGRTIGVKEPNGKITYTVYNDAEHEVRVYPGWFEEEFEQGTIEPVIVMREDWENRYTETLTMFLEIDVDESSNSFDDYMPLGTESFDEDDILSLSRQILNDAGQVVERDVYTSLADYDQSEAHLTDPGTAFLPTFISYNGRGTLKRQELPDGTITRYFYDVRKLLTSTWKGTDDALDDPEPDEYWSPSTQGTNETNMLLVSLSRYDDDGNQIEGHAVTDNNSQGLMTDSIVTRHFFDWRDRMIGARDENNIATIYTLDNQGATTQVDVFRDNNTNFVLDSGELRARSLSYYDERHMVYKSVKVEVNPLTGDDGDFLTTKMWYDKRGNLIKTSTPLGLFSKTKIDGAGRQVASYLSYDSDGDEFTTPAENYFEALDVDDDFVIEQTTTLYDKALPIVTTSYKRTSNSSGMGELASDDSFIQTAITWYDDITNRPIATANFGQDNLEDRYVYTSGGDIIDDGVLNGSEENNGLPDFYDVGVPAFPGSLYDYILNRTYYDDAGRVSITVNNNEVETRYYYDLMGRRVKMIENYDNFVDEPTDADTESDKLTLWKYDTKGRLFAMYAYNSNGSSTTAQTTIYGHSDLTDASLVTETFYPDFESTISWNQNDATLIDSVSGSDHVSIIYDRLGRLEVQQDQREVQHNYHYDNVGRLQADRVSDFGASEDVDETVKLIQTTYDDLSRVIKVTSHGGFDSLTLLGNDPLNEVMYDYDGWGNIIRAYQEHDDEVNEAQSSKVEYIYGDAVNGTADQEQANYIRLEQVKYPNGRRLYLIYNQNNSIGGRLVRPWRYADNASGSNYLAEIEYIGASTIIREDRPISVGLTLTFDYGQSGSLGGLDRFGRIFEMTWTRDEDGDSDFDLDIDRTRYTYDRNSNRLYREQVTDGVPEGFDEGYTYDGLDRLNGFSVGTLGGGGITDNTLDETWELDTQGNWATYWQDPDGEGVGTVQEQNRTVNEANELTGITGDMDWDDPTYDAAGNMTQMPRSMNMTTSQDGVYDAWNRLISIFNVDQEEFDGVYEYDGLGRRIEKITDTVLGSTATEDIYFNESWQILETVVDGQTYEQFTWDPRYIDAPIARYRNANIGSMDGALDADFGISGKVTTDFGGNDLGRRVAVQADGKIVVIGSSDADFAIARYNVDGTLDDSFGTDGVLVDDLGGADQAFSVGITFLGKILVAGGSDSYSAVVQYNEDGSRDTSFSGDGLALVDVSGDEDTERFFDMTIDSYGRIVLVGQKLAPTAGTLVRLGSAGSLDTSFDSDGIMIVDPGDGLKSIRGIAIDSSNRIVVAGEGHDYEDVFAIARFNEDGTYDDEFGNGGVKLMNIGADDEAYSVAVDAEGRIVVAGEAYVYNPGSSTSSLAIGVMRLLSEDGSLDASFSSDGKAFYDDYTENERGQHLAIDAQGKIVITGTHDDDVIVVRFSDDGTMDTTFDSDGVAVTDFGSTDDSFGLALKPSGEIVIVGASDGDLILAQHLSGTNQHTFYTYDANYNVTAALDRDGNVVERYTYTPYGQRTVIDDDWSSDGDGLSDISSNFGHQGGMMDVESGLMKFRHRDYHVSLGNWVERDPLGYADGMNLYQSYGLNPLIRVDPLGLESDDMALQYMNYTVPDYSNNTMRQWDHSWFQAQINVMTAKVEAGQISKCRAFSILLGELFTLSDGRLSQFFNDAIHYFTLPSLTYLGGYEDYINARHVGWKNNWSPPNWLNDHNRTGRLDGYIQDSGDPDDSGRHDHFLMNGWAKQRYGVWTMFGTSPNEDGSSTDRTVNALGRRFARFMMNNYFSGDGNAVARWVFENLCDEYYWQGRRGPRCNQRD